MDLEVVGETPVKLDDIKTSASLPVADNSAEIAQKMTGSLGFGIFERKESDLRSDLSARDLSPVKFLEDNIMKPGYKRPNNRVSHLSLHEFLGK